MHPTTRSSADRAFCFRSPIRERRREPARHKSDETWYNQLERWLDPCQASVATAWEVSNDHPSRQASFRSCADLAHPCELIACRLRRAADHSPSAGGSREDNRQPIDYRADRGNPGHRSPHRDQPGRGAAARPGARGAGDRRAAHRCADAGRAKSAATPAGFAGRRAGVRFPIRSPAAAPARTDDQHSLPATDNRAPARRRGERRSRCCATRRKATCRWRPT